jgi:dihydroorotase
MQNTLLLDPVRILHGPGVDEQHGAVFIENGVLRGFDENARSVAAERGVAPTRAGDKLIAPCLVDPHSVLEDPVNGRAETLLSLTRCATAGGYGTIALLPRSGTWRDRTERLALLESHDPSRLTLHLWGSFSTEGKGEHLSCHGDLLEHGAIGLADDDAIVPLALLERGLLLAEMQSAPVLLAPRDPDLQADGLAREGVETLRAGWAPDPTSSELLPLTQLLALQRQHPQRNLRCMNLSTAEAVLQLRSELSPPMASVSWWHLIADSGCMQNDDPGWCVRPSIGSPADRLALQQALQEGLITAVAVHAVPLDEEDMLLPADQRPPGLSGHHLVLPLLWEALIRQSGWSVPQLWQALSFGPSLLLNKPAERLSAGSDRWLIFDPDHQWRVDRQDPAAPLAANIPCQGTDIRGRVLASGLSRSAFQFD